MFINKKEKKWMREEIARLNCENKINKRQIEIIYKNYIDKLKIEINTLRIELNETSNNFYNFEKQTKENWTKAMKRIENLEKQCELYVNALNEQRTTIENVIKVIKYICEKTNIDLKEKPKTKEKKGK